MALEPCKVCGTLNSREVEICLSCGYPTKGRPQTLIFRWIAIGLVMLLTVPVVIGLIDRIRGRFRPPQNQQAPAVLWINRVDQIPDLNP